MDWQQDDYEYDYEYDYDYDDNRGYSSNEDTQLDQKDYQFQNDDIGSQLAYDDVDNDDDFNEYQLSNNSDEQEEYQERDQELDKILNMFLKIPNISQRLNNKKDELFSFSSYSNNLTSPLNLIQTPKLQYLIDEINISDINFGTIMKYGEFSRNNNQMGLMDKQQYIIFNENKKLASNAILRLKKEVEIGGIIQILYNSPYPIGSYTQKQMKIQIKVSLINEILCFHVDKNFCLTIEGTPEFYVNCHQDTRPLFKRTPSNLKTGPKRWERVQNLSLSEIGQKDLIITYLNIKKGCFWFKNGFNFEHYANQIQNTLIQLQKIPIKKINISMQTMMKPLKQLNEVFSVNLMGKKLQPIEKIHKFTAFEIGFTLISFLFECYHVNIDQIYQTISLMTKFINNIQNNHEGALKKMKNTLININKSELFIKMSKGDKLKDIFKKKYLKNMKREKQKDFSKEQNVQIKSVKITPSGIIPTGWNTDLRNRLLRQFRNHDFQFMRIQVTNDDDARQVLRGGGKFLSKVLRKMFSCVKIFGHQFIPIGWTQSQLKNSSLWFTYGSKNPYAKQLGIIERQQLLDFLGKFEEIKNPALKAARIGQNLTTSKSIDLGKINIIYAQDDCVGRYKYTDGIGKISPDLVKKIQTQLQIPGTVFQIRFLGIKGVVILNRQIPENTIVVRKSMVKFECNHPDAGRYFDILDFNYFKPGFLNHQILVLLDANRVERQNIKDIQKQYIKNLLQGGLNFKDHLQKGKSSDIVNSFKQKNFNILERDKRKIDNIAEVVKHYNQKWQIQILNQPTLRGIMIEKYYSKLKRLVKKTHVKIEKSARILGIIDDYNILKQNEVYCTILKDESNGQLVSKATKKKMKNLYRKMNDQETKSEKQQHILKQMHQKMNRDEKQRVNLKKLSKKEIKFWKKIKQQKSKLHRQNIRGPVMVTRNPCMHPADIRILQCVSKEQASERFKQKYGSKNFFQEMPNCLIFPKSGSIPITAQISGSDLDGDNFFITWDQRLIPQSSIDPFVTDDQYIPQRTWGGDTFHEMMEFFCQFVFNNKLGRLSNAHLSIADRQGAFSSRCIKLCKIHNRAVDYPKKGYNFQYQRQLWVKQFPHYMEKQSKKISYKSKSILGELYDEALNFYQQFVMKSKQNYYNLGYLKPYMAFKYTEQSIQEACNIVLEFNRQIDRLKEIYALQREFQVYNMKISYRTKESRTKVSFIDEIKIKYFEAFFDKMQISDPFQFIFELKNKKNGNKDDQYRVTKKFMLWYLISHIQLLQMDKENKNEVMWFQNVRKYLKGAKIENIGLCWFCIPFIAYHVLNMIRNRMMQKQQAKKC